MKEFDAETLINIDRDPLLSESDRGCVLILTSDLDNYLNEILSFWFKNIGNVSNKQEKVIFDFSGPLGSFSNKIQLSKALGIIDDTIYRDLLIIRKIRNLAAHSNNSFSLSNNTVKNKIRNLHNISKHSQNIPRFDYKSKNQSTFETNTLNENLMKGLGYLRADKVFFILNVQNILIILKNLRNLLNKNLFEINKILSKIKEENKSFIEEWNKTELEP